MPGAPGHSFRPIFAENDRAGAAAHTPQATADMPFDRLSRLRIGPLAYFLDFLNVIAIFVIDSGIFWRRLMTARIIPGAKGHVACSVGFSMNLRIELFDF